MEYETSREALNSKGFCHGEPFGGAQDKLRRTIDRSRNVDPSTTLRMTFRQLFRASPSIPEP